MGHPCLEDTALTCAVVWLELLGALTVRSVPKRTHLSSKPSVPEVGVLPTEGTF